MNKTAALGAAAGSAVLALFYFVTNGIPVLRNLDSLPASALAQPVLILLLPQLLWTWFFLTFWRRHAEGPAALITLLAAVAPQTLYSWLQTWPTFSFLSLDSIFYLFSGVMEPLAYAWFLAAIFRSSTTRRAAYILWVLTTFQAMATIVTTSMTLLSFAGSLAVFVSPVVLILHWGSQSFFFRALRKLDTH
jgi:hypothetical protein